MRAKKQKAECILKSRNIRIRRYWKLKPVTKIKESGKLYTRKKKGKLNENKTD